MYTKQDLINRLINENKTIDFDTIYCSLTNWSINPIYTDENNLEHYDDAAIQKLNTAIELKNQGKSDLEINSIINNSQEDSDKSLNEQTFEQIAELIAKKVSDNIYNPLMNSAKLKRDNEIMAQQIEKLIKNNEKLTSKINSLEQENSKFKQIYGPVYIKQP